MQNAKLDGKWIRGRNEKTGFFKESPAVKPETETRNTRHTSRRKILFLIIIPFFLIAWGSGGLIKEGNKYYNEGQYGKAIEKYRQAGNSLIVHYNVGNAFYKQQKYKEAIEEYRRVLVTKDIRLREKAYYNMGNAQFKLSDLKSAIDSYENALRLEPSDLQAKYNLEYALKEKDRLPKSSNKTNTNKKKQKKAMPPQNKSESKMSKNDVKRVLNTIRKEERELQRKLLYRKLLEAENTTVGKDW